MEFTCTFCDELIVDQEPRQYRSCGSSDLLCKDCAIGASQCACGEQWGHTDLGGVADYDYFDEEGVRYTCNDCGQAERVCEECEAEAASADDIRRLRVGRDYKQVCETCYQEVYNIDPDAIAASMTDDAEVRGNIAATIRNNMEHRGSAWAALPHASREEKWNLIGAMEAASERHESTNYDQLLASGMSREAARELKC